MDLLRSLRGHHHVQPVFAAFAGDPHAVVDSGALQFVVGLRVEEVVRLVEHQQERAPSLTTAEEAHDGERHHRTLARIGERAGVEDDGTLVVDAADERRFVASSPHAPLGDAQVVDPSLQATRPFVVGMLELREHRVEAVAVVAGQRIDGIGERSELVAVAQRVEAHGERLLAERQVGQVEPQREAGGPGSGHTNLACGTHRRLEVAMRTL